MADIPLFDTNRQTGALRDEINHTLSRIVESGKFILGPWVSEFESLFAA